MLADSLALVTTSARVGRGRFLEAGCGASATAFNLAKRGWQVAGLDLSEAALAAARSAFESNGLSGEFHAGDVREIPWDADSFDLLYAGGVVEHFRETDAALREFARVLVPGGVAVVTVPALTFSWPYLFLRGNVPAKGRAEAVGRFVQFELLRGRLAKYGYERSFTRGDFRRLMVNAGFEKVRVSAFDTFLPLPQLPGPLRASARRLAKHDAFCPMWAAVGVKPE
jgi:ubiquinone/menaquinone biosynthesis C-methylase UbiE